ncbi:MAG: HDIG domain-containing protein [Chloroflexi bacterium]|nr:HDIG domain-containing protein [Chloroflexota bacterium]
MSRPEALQSLQVNLENQNLVKHCLATEAILRALARRLGQDEETWGITGLLHDIDLELTEGDKNTHSKLGADLARELGASDATCQAILRHNEAHGLPRLSPLDKALWCTDPLTGLITAAALVQPEKKLARVTADSLLKRYKEKRFAAGADREAIADCAELGLTLEQFLALGLEAMQGVAGDLGL